jgi:hypothetical protein
MAAADKAIYAIRRAKAGARGNLVLRVAATIADTLAGGPRTTGGRIYQFKVTLRDVRPPIWRRIQVKNSTLDKLHEHIQTAMGWTNSHLHQFRINDQFYADPALMAEDFVAGDCEDSTATKLGDVLPHEGGPFAFEYDYDFGDSWHHDVDFQGRLLAEPGRRYPLCIDGARACPPEDVGGAWGYQDFLEAIADPANERHEELRNWVGGGFEPEAFSAVAATVRMLRGLTDWRLETAV